jgi:diacylglycerol O-acyltransferase / wax synthase
MSPATTGGLGGFASLLPRLLTSDPDADPAGETPAEASLGERPSVVELVADTVVELAENQLSGARIAGAALPGALRGAVGLLRGAGEQRFRIPRTVFNEPLTSQRALALARIPLADINAVKDGFGVGVTDVFLAACTLSVRTWLRRHHAVPEHPLVMRVPDSDSFRLVHIPVQLDDPVEVLKAVHSESSSLPLDFPKIAGLVAPSVVHAGTRMYTGLRLSRRLPPLSHGLTAHIPVPPTPAYCVGAQVIGIYAVAPLIEGAGLNITSISHGGPDGDMLDVSVFACPDQVDDIEAIADGIVDAATELRAMRKKKHRPPSAQT